MTAPMQRTAFDAMPSELPARPTNVDCFARCTASDILRWTRMASDATAQTDSVLFATRPLKVGAPLVHEGTRFESLYFVGAGTFKCVRMDQDGGEQVQEFAMKGDALGLDAFCSGRYGSTAIALEESMVAVVPFRAFVEAGRQLPVLERMLHCVVSRNLMSRSRTMQLMVTVGADVRVARFLLDWARRQGTLGYSTRRLRLRMTRIDIASHLGVSHETVSRSFTTLAHCGLIKVSQRDIEILDPAGLQALHGTPRRASEGKAGVSPPAAAPGWPVAPFSSAFQ